MEVTRWENGVPSVIHTAACGDDKETALEMLISRGDVWCENAAYGALLMHGDTCVASYNVLDAVEGWNDVMRWVQIYEPTFDTRTRINVA